MKAWRLKKCSRGDLCCIIQWLQICITLMRSRTRDLGPDKSERYRYQVGIQIRMKVIGRIRISIKVKKACI
jgi:hypothetical protein